jgi:signal transduction histidine kinase
MDEFTGHNGHVGKCGDFGEAKDVGRFRWGRGASINDAMGQHDQPHPEHQPGKEPDKHPRKRVAKVKGNAGKAADGAGASSGKAVRPGSQDVPIVADRATVLAHELNNLLDGTMRCLGIARKSLAVEFASSEAASLDTARQQMDTVKGALERMCELVHASMMAESVHKAQLLPGYGKRGLNDAVKHAVEVVQPAANQAGVVINVDLDAALDDVPAGPLYSAVLNGLQNAVESVHRTGGSGSVSVVTRCDQSHNSPASDGLGDRVVVEIHDEGIGLPSDVAADDLFEFGRSTKGSTGIGLGVIRAIARDMNGSVELLPRGTMGACLRMTFPLPGIDESPNEEDAS